MRLSRCSNSPRALSLCRLGRLWRRHQQIKSRPFLQQQATESWFTLWSELCVTLPQLYFLVTLSRLFFQVTVCQQLEHGHNTVHSFQSTPFCSSAALKLRQSGRSPPGHGTERCPHNEATCIHRVYVCSSSSSSSNIPYPV